MRILIRGGTVVSATDVREMDVVIDGERIAAEAAGPVTTVVMPEGVHVVNNLWPQARALVGDWVAEHLAAAPQR